MAFLFENKAISFLQTSLSAVATSVTLGATEGDNFPAPTGGNMATLVLENRAAGTFEIVYLTARSGDVLTITRGREGTSAQSWGVGSSISLRVTKAVFDSFAAYGPRLDQAETDITALEGTVSAMVATVIDTLYPVGALYFSSIATNPGTTLGRGTWTAHAAGRAIVGVGNNGEATWAGGATRGSETHTLTEAEMPAHIHTNNPPAASTNTTGNHSHTAYYQDLADGGGSQNTVSGASGNDGGASTSTNGNHSHTVNIPQFNSASTGGGTAHNNVQPSIGVYVWRRTA